MLPRGMTQTQLPRGDILLRLLDRLGKARRRFHDSAARLAQRGAADVAAEAGDIALVLDSVRVTRLAKGAFVALGEVPLVP